MSENTENQMHAEDFMTKNVIVCRTSDTVALAARLMTEHKISIIPVVDEKEYLVGVITVSDFIGKEIEIPHALVSIKRLMGKNFYRINIEDILKKAEHLTLEKVMSTKLATVHAKMSLHTVVSTMIEKGHKRLPVLEKGKVVGLITRKDIVKAFTLLA